MRFSNKSTSSNFVLVVLFLLLVGCQERAKIDEETLSDLELLELIKKAATSRNDSLAASISVDQNFWLNLLKSDSSITVDSTSSKGKYIITMPDMRVHYNTSTRQDREWDRQIREIARWIFIKKIARDAEKNKHIKRDRLDKLIAQMLNDISTDEVEVKKTEIADSSNKENLSNKEGSSSNPPDNKTDPVTLSNANNFQAVLIEKFEDIEDILRNMHKETTGENKELCEAELQTTKQLKSLYLAQLKSSIEKYRRGSITSNQMSDIISEFNTKIKSRNNVVAEIKALVAK